MSCLQYAEVWIAGNKYIYDRSNREIILTAHPKHQEGKASFYMGTVSQVDSETLEEPDLIVYIFNNFLKEKEAVLDTTETKEQEIVKKELVKDIANGAGGAINLEINDKP
jgi:hypothetical protein